MLGLMTTKAALESARVAVLGILLGPLGCATPPPEGVSPVLWDLCRDDLQLRASDCQAISAWRLSEALPVARGNAYADDERAARLGQRIFFDEGFS
jgi:hypothetical protein